MREATEAMVNNGALFSEDIFTCVFSLILFRVDSGMNMATMWGREKHH